MSSRAAEPGGAHEETAHSARSAPFAFWVLERLSEKRFPVVDRASGMPCRMPERQVRRGARRCFSARPGSTDYFQTVFLAEAAAEREAWAAALLAAAVAALKLLSAISTACFVALWTVS